MGDEQIQVGRLALRVEGDWWHAYYARPNTMDGALHLGSIKLTAVAANPRAKAMFMDAMREVVSEMIQRAGGMRPTWKKPEAAPEHERAGKA